MHKYIQIDYWHMIFLIIHPLSFLWIAFNLRTIHEEPPSRRGWRGSQNWFITGYFQREARTQCQMQSIFVSSTVDGPPGVSGVSKATNVKNYLKNLFSWPYFGTLLIFSWILALQTNKVLFSTKFQNVWHPGHPWECICSVEIY